ncbi:MAG: hypothetical protein AAFX44_08950 [Pseudomonadota bacterium]
MPPSAHWFIGLAGLVVFVVQGQYLVHVAGPMPELADGPRMLYRSGHIYLLLTSLINLAIARAETPAPGWRRRVHRVTSAIVAVSPIVMMAGFLVEPTSGTLERPITALGLYAMFGAGVLWSFAFRPTRRHR